jgi:hypothetical protein
MNVKLTAQQNSKLIYTAADHAIRLPLRGGLAYRQAGRNRGGDILIKPFKNQIYI